MDPAGDGFGLATASRPVLPVADHQDRHPLAKLPFEPMQHRFASVPDMPSQERLVAVRSAPTPAYVVRVELLADDQVIGGAEAGTSISPTRHSIIGGRALPDVRSMVFESHHRFVTFRVPRREVDVGYEPSGAAACGEMQRERPDVNPVLVALVEAILPSLANVRPRDPQSLDDIDRVFEGLVATGSAGRHTCQRSPCAGLAPWQERRAKELLAAAIQGGLSVEEVASACRLSRGHFSKAFKQSTGQSPHHWLTSRRIDSAKVLLEESDSTIAEVALACGFSDQSHLTRTFTRLAGLPPATWRRRNRRLQTQQHTNEDGRDFSVHRLTHFERVHGGVPPLEVALGRSC